MPKEDVKEETHILWFALVNSASGKFPRSYIVLLS